MDKYETHFFLFTIIVFSFLLAMLTVAMLIEPSENTLKLRCIERSGDWDITKKVCIFKK